MAEKLALLNNGMILRVGALSALRIKFATGRTCGIGILPVPDLGQAGCPLYSDSLFD
ncbi:hypothetical protein [Moorena producens]|uniref:hypothetical protein n=1 Tax=Moorena producens TaxID=1155739 RepID=UPI001314A2D1|nr:hypothetical protein [Moorena producens]